MQTLSIREQDNGIAIGDVNNKSLLPECQKITNLSEKLVAKNSDILKGLKLSSATF